MTIRFTDEQMRVVRWQGGPLVVASVAGSGKSAAILGLVGDLTRSRGVSPRKIIVVTFSKAGATDMERRARAMGIGGEFRTLHSLAREILFEVPTSRRPLVIGSREQWWVKKVLKRELQAIKRERYLPDDDDGLPKVSAVLREIETAQSALIFPESWTTAKGQDFPAYLDWAQKREREPLDKKDAEVFDRLYKRLEAIKAAPETDEDLGFTDHAGHRWLTFGDMIALVGRAILRGDPWVEPFRGRYDWVIVDEVQDNSLGQWVMAEFVSTSANNIVAVGDDQQSIYGFRGAVPALMKEFWERLDATLAVFSLNFRCGQTILDAANGILARAVDRLYEGDLKRGRPEDAVGVTTGTSYHDPKDEAASVADQIQAVIGDGAPADDISVLYRINSQSGPFEVELVKRGIPYRVAGSSFFSRPEVKAAVSYLAVAIDPNDEDGWKIAYRQPTRFLGNAFLSAFPTFASARDGLAGMDRRFSRNARPLVRHVEEVRRLIESQGAAGALGYVFEEIGVRVFFRDEKADADIETEVDEAATALVTCAESLSSAAKEPEGRVADAAKLVAFAREMLRKSREVSDHDGHLTKRVTLSTVHKSKGLQWNRVFVVGVTEGLFPFKNAIEAEERRLGYVALTRAEDFLHVSWTEQSGNGSKAGASSLVSDAGLLAQTV